MFGLVDVVSMSILDALALLVYAQGILAWFTVGRALRAMPIFGMITSTFLCALFSILPPEIWKHCGMNAVILFPLFFVIMILGFYTAHREMQGS